LTRQAHFVHPGQRLHAQHPVASLREHPVRAIECDEECGMVLMFFLTVLDKYIFLNRLLNYRS